MEACFQQLLNKAPTCRSQALAFSSSLPHAGDLLNVIPSAILGLHLHDWEFRCCLRYWPGVPLHSSPYPCPECRCTADPIGDRCGENGDHIARHNNVCDIIYAAAQSAALAPSRETLGLVPGSQARPDNIFLPCWSLGHPSAFDVLIISPLQELTAAKTPGHALKVGVQRKLTNNLSACCSSGTDFSPLVSAAWLRTPSTSAELSRTDTVPQTLLPPPSTCLAAWQSPCGGAMPPPAPHPSPLPGRLTTSLLLFFMPATFLPLKKKKSKPTQLIGCGNIHTLDI